MKLGDYLKKGFDHYVQMKQADVELDPDLIAAFITIQMVDTNIDESSAHRIIFNQFGNIMLREMQRLTTMSQVHIIITESSVRRGLDYFLG